MKYACVIVVLAASVIPSGELHAEEDTGFNALLRMQYELVEVDAGEDEDSGLYLTDGWAGGQANSQNWGALFLDGREQINDDLMVFGRLGFNVNAEGVAEGSARQRDVKVGLSGEFGELVAGRLETPYKVAGLGWDPLNATFLQARGNLGRSGGAFGHASYLDNAIRYTRSVGDASVSAFGALDDPGGEGSGDRHAWGVSAVSPAGPVELLVSHIDASRFRGGPDDRTATKLGLRYREGPFTFTTHHEQRGEGFEDGDFLFLSGMYETASWSLVLNHGQFSADGPSGDADYYALGARYRAGNGLSIHGGVRRSDPDQASAETIAGLGMRVIVGTGWLSHR